MTRMFRVTALTAWFALLTLILNWQTWLAPPETLPISMALILTAVPLLLPMRGLLHGRPYTHAWTTFLALPYFILGVDAVAAGTDPAWLGWAAIAASVALFTGATGYVRCRGRELRAANEQ